MEQARKKPQQQPKQQAATTAVPLRPPPLSPQFVRDTAELEGALLLPEARAVSERTDERAATSESIPTAHMTVATATPTTYFEYDDDDDDASKHVEEVEIDVAPSLPATTAHDPDRDKLLIGRSAFKGKMDAEQEKEEIQRGNREVYAINYTTKQELRQANLRAASLQRKENMGMTTTTTTTTEEQTMSKKEKEEISKAPEFYKGTYGKEYEVSTYETKKYDTTDYDVSEYKSVYER